MVPQSLRNLSSSGAAVSSRPGRINAIWRVPSRSFRCCASFQAQGERQKLQQQSGQKSFQDSNLACPWPRQDFATPKKSDRPLWNAVLCSLGVSSAVRILWKEWGSSSKGVHQIWRSYTCLSRWGLLHYKCFFLFRVPSQMMHSYRPRCSESPYSLMPLRHYQSPLRG